MTKDMKCTLIALAMVLTAPLLFGMAYLLWPQHLFAAIALLFIGFTTDLVGGFKLLDATLSQA
jgi:hypothetical protein